MSNSNKLDIPVLEVGPKFLLLARGDVVLDRASFDADPSYMEGPVDLFTVNDKGVHSRRYKDILSVDLESAVAFIASGNAYSVHPKRIFGNLAWWARIRGVVNAETYYRAFMGINDLSVACRAPDAPMTLDERLDFGPNDIALLTGRDTRYESMEELVQDCYNLCQKLYTVR